MNVINSLTNLSSAIKLASSTKKLVGTDRLEILNDVWAMYIQTYKNIGISVSSPNGLLKYDLWEVIYGEENSPIAFGLFTETHYGLKFCLAGNTGTPEGKNITVSNLRSMFKKTGYYGEASHKVLEISLNAGAPVVCPAYVSKILGKHITPNQEKVISYFRNLEGVGMVEKVMLGTPKGIPTTDAENPICPIPKDAKIIGASELSEDEHSDLQRHLGCLIDLTEG